MSHSRSRVQVVPTMRAASLGRRLTAALHLAGFVRLRREGSHARLRGTSGQLITVKRMPTVSRRKSSRLTRAGQTFAFACVSKFSDAV